MQPQVSISTAFLYDIPIEKQLTLIAEVGFKLVSLGSSQEHFGYLDHQERSQLKLALYDNGLQIDTIHAPHWITKSGAFSEIRGTIEAAADIVAGCVVTHGGPFDCKAAEVDDLLRILIKNCSELLPIAQSHGVVIALENVMPGPATNLIKRALLELDNTVFGLCYDSSHDQIDGPRPFDLIDEFQGRIFSVHLSDRIKPFVDHVIPGEGFIDWPAMCSKLRLAGYDKPILMEVLMQHSRFKETREFLWEAYRAGVEIWQAIQN